MSWKVDVKVSTLGALVWTLLVLAWCIAPALVIAAWRWAL